MIDNVPSVGIDVITIQTYSDIPVVDAQLMGNTVRNVTGSPAYGIRISAPEGVSVQGGLVEDCAGLGIYLAARAREIHRYEVSGVTLRNNTTLGIIVGQLSPGSVAGNVSITGCHFIDDRATPAMTEGVRLQVNTGGSWQRIVLQQNQFDGIATPFRRIGTFTVADLVLDAAVTTATARPTDRTRIWSVGERALNTAPAAGGWSGWIAMTGGRAHQDSLGTRTAGSPTVTSVTNLGTWAVGDTIRGTGIPSGTTVAAVDAVNGTLTLSQNATTAATQQSLYDAQFKGFGAIET